MTRLFAMLCLCLTAGALWAQGVTLPEPRVVELDNGATFIVLEKRDVPLVGIHAMLRGGAVTDLVGKAGLAGLLAQMLEKGAGERDAETFAETVDATGATLHASAELESISIAGEFLAADAGLGIELLADMLRAPMLDAREFGKLRDRRDDSVLRCRALERLPNPARLRALGLAAQGDVVGDPVHQIAPPFERSVLVAMPNDVLGHAGVQPRDVRE